MKKLFIFGFILVNFSLAAQINYTWTLTTAGNATNAASWSPSGVPSSTDNVIFDGTSTTNCTWDIPAIGGFSVMAGYTGVITMSSGSKNIRNNIVINSGTVIATSGTITKQLTGTASVFILGAGGVFTHNSGTFLLQVDAGDNYVFSGNIILNNLDIGAAFSTGERFINFGSNLTANNVVYSHFFTPDPVSYQGTIHIKSSLDLSSNSNTGALFGTNNANFIFDGASANIIGASAADISRLPNIEINVAGNYSITNHLSIIGNWTHTNGTLTAGSSTENFYGSAATISGTGAAFHNLVVQSGATVSMPASAEVKVGGSLTMTGTLNFQTTSALGLNGTGAQSIGLGGKTLAAINAYNTGSSRVVTLSGAINISDSIKAEFNVILNTGGSLSLKSDATQTARVATSKGTILGNVTVETFIPGPFTGWANLGVRGVNGQSVANWDTHLSSGGANGIPMTCSLCSYPSDALGSWFNSIQGWNESNSSYDSLTVNSALNPGTGFWVYVGDGQSSTSGLTLINTGSLVQGDVPITVTAAGSGTNVGFNLVANPYASPISTKKIFQNLLNASPEFNETVYMWNADLFSGAGGFVSFNSSGVSSPTGFNGDVIASGQGFYVDYQGLFFGLNTLSLSEEMKVDNSGGASPLLRSTGSSTLSYFRLKLDGSTDGDETVISINQNATEFFDGKYDGKKILQTPGYVGYPGNYSHYTTLSSKDANGKDYSINTLPTLTKNANVPLMVRVSASGTYTLSSFDFNNFDNCLVLIDKLDNSYHDLRVSPYSFTISDTTSAPRFELVLCKNQLDVVTAIEETKSSLSSIDINQDQQGAFVKTNFSQNTKATISVFNIMGQKLMEDIQVEGTVTNTHLNLNLHNQVVFIRVVSEKENTTKKMVLH